MPERVCCEHWLFDRVCQKNAIVAIRPPWSEPTMLLWHLLHSLVPNYHMAYSMGTIYNTYHDH
jgi:hypothetical protein